jgi:hypothetical protein
VYATYQLVQTVLWSSVWRQDRREHPEFGAPTGGYVVGIRVVVVGRLQQRAWTAEDSSARSVVEVVAEELRSTARAACPTRTCQGDGHMP